MIHIVYINFPPSVFGAVKLKRDGSYLIAINENLPPDEKEKTIKHELAHIRLDHFNSDKSIQKIEREAEEEAEKIDI